MPPFPASAAGPDLRQLVLGSEGRLGLPDRRDPARHARCPRWSGMEAWALPGWARRPWRPCASSRRRGPACRSSASPRPAETRDAARLRGPPSRRPARCTATSGSAASPSDWVLLLDRRRRAGGASRRPPRAEAASISGGTTATRIPALATPGTGPASARRTCATRCGRPATASDTLETATDWAHVPAPRSRASRRPRRAPWRPAASGCTCSPTCRTSTRPAPACT